MNLRAIWSDLSTEERLRALIEYHRAHAPGPDLPGGPRPAGYWDALADAESYVLDGNPLPEPEVAHV